MRLRSVMFGVTLMLLVLVRLALGQTPNLTEYRLSQLEEVVRSIAWQHAWLAGLLIANLVAVLVSLSITLLTRKRR